MLTKVNIDVFVNGAHVNGNCKNIIRFYFLLIASVITNTSC